MLAKEKFKEQLNEAYRHLYDLVYLRTHSLLDILVPDIQKSRKQRAWQCHHLLLAIIEELKPAPQIDALSRQWRRYQAMVLRYVKALDPDVAAEQLAISRRQFYREHKLAMEAIADILWERYGVKSPDTPHTPKTQVATSAPEDRLTLLRMEAARMTQTGRLAQVGEVLQGVLPFLQELQKQRDLDIHLDLPDNLPRVTVEQGLLRQLLLSILGYLAGHTEHSRLAVTGKVGETEVVCAVCVLPSTSLSVATETTMVERLATLHEMALVSNATVSLTHEGGLPCGFSLHLPIAERIVLSVDDNEDMLALFERYLRPHHYRIVIAQTAQEALEKAVRLEPHIITLDLMMPQQDGWDLLQTLLHHPTTQHIPIIVCSVLKQKELVLSLGATAFLEKPVTEHDLLTTLEALDSA